MKRARPDDRAEEGAGHPDEDEAALGQMIKSTNRLAALSDGEMYDKFFVPVLRRLANEPAVRAELVRQAVEAGAHPVADPDCWVKHRRAEFVRAGRRPNADCSTEEMTVRSFETRVVVELCFQGNVEWGIKQMQQTHARLSGDTAIGGYARYYVNTAKRFRVRAYRFYPLPPAKAPPPARTRAVPEEYAALNARATGARAGAARRAVPDRPPVREALAPLAATMPPIERWTPDQAAVFLRAAGFNNAAKRCARHGIGGARLQQNATQFFRESLGMARKADHERLNEAIAFFNGTQERRMEEH